MVGFVPSRRIIVFGANGATGKLVVNQALAGGHSVTAFVRRADGLPEHAALRVVNGDAVRDEEAIAVAAQCHDAAVSVLGGALATREGRRSPIVGPATATIAQALQRAGVGRAAILLSYGSGATTSLAPLPVRLLVRPALRRYFADLDAADTALTTSSLDWTVFHALRLKDGPATGRATVSTRLTWPPVPQVARADLAALMLDAVTSDHFVKQRVVVSGARSGDRDAEQRQHRIGAGIARAEQDRRG